MVTTFHSSEQTVSVSGSRRSGRNVLAHASTLADIVVALGPAIPVPLISSIFASVKVIVDAANSMRFDRRQAGELALLAEEMAIKIREELDLQKDEGEMGPRLLASLQHLDLTLLEVKNTLESHGSYGPVLRVLKRAKISDQILECKTKLDHALRLFMLSSSVRIEHSVLHMTSLFEDERRREGDYRVYGLGDVHFLRHMRHLDERNSNEVRVKHFEAEVGGAVRTVRVYSDKENHLRAVNVLKHVRKWTDVRFAQLEGYSMRGCDTPFIIIKGNEVRKLSSYVETLPPVPNYVEYLRAVATMLDARAFLLRNNFEYFGSCNDFMINAGGELVLGIDDAVRPIPCHDSNDCTLDKHAFLSRAVWPGVSAIDLSFSGGYFEERLSDYEFQSTRRKAIFTLISALSDPAHSLLSYDQVTLAWFAILSETYKAGGNRSESTPTPYQVEVGEFGAPYYGNGISHITALDKSRAGRWNLRRKVFHRFQPGACSWRVLTPMQSDGLPDRENAFFTFCPRYDAEHSKAQFYMSISSSIQEEEAVAELASFGLQAGKNMKMALANVILLYSKVQIIEVSCTSAGHREIFFQMLSPNRDGFFPQPAGYFSFSPKPKSDDYRMNLSEGVIGNERTREAFWTARHSFVEYKSTLPGVEATIRQRYVYSWVYFKKCEGAVAEFIHEHFGGSQHRASSSGARR